MEMDKVIAWNQDQILHAQLVQMHALGFSNKLMESAVEHDSSKWSEVEYTAFLESHGSLKESKSGEDAEYQKHLKGAAIQHHIHSNPHHPEYWDRAGKPMPLHEIILMFFDWRARSLSKGGDMEGFWKYNIAKLANQPHAIPVVEMLKREYC
jgi:hypothetical protein